ncbi:MAG: PHA/PHB synthase family protein [Rhodomicrobium sp.]
MTTSSNPLDRFYHYTLAKQTGGLSPVALWLAFMDWALHLSLAPGTRTKLAAKLISSGFAYQNYLAGAAGINGETPSPVVEANPRDKRFSRPEWSQWPYSALAQGFLLCEQFWDEATRNVRGVSRDHGEAVNFCARQLLDTVAPSNFPATNPEILERTLRDAGTNLVRGYWNFIEDSVRRAAGLPPAGVEGFKPGKTIAVTPGKVIARTRMIELIQYSPATSTVYPEPLLIVPAWIMKYYVLDLSPSNSLVRYLVGQGFTVFTISWKNPDESYRDAGIDDYRRLGIMEALHAISKIVPDRKVHALGYCLGGTLLSIAAAAMARDGDERLKTLTLLAAQTDFSEPGELELFVNESQLAFLEDQMQEAGVLHAEQMTASFQLLRSNDLIWSRMLKNYLMVEREPLNDLMAWNADATRMPARMHSEYLRDIFFENRLAEGRYLVDGHAIALRDIKAPIFAVGTEWDHIAPWRSVYQINVLADTDVTFLLTNGGHNAGIVSEPGRKDRHYRVATLKAGEPYHEPDAWFHEHQPISGSWWPEWVNWLNPGSNEFSAPPPMGAPDEGYPPLCDAPGTYVFE